MDPGEKEDVGEAGVISLLLKVGMDRVRIRA